MQIENVCTKQEYTDRNGNKKTKWLNVGILKTTEGGKKYLELNMYPNTPFYVFEQRKKEEAAEAWGDDQQ
jgi:hypothetical protein